MYRTLDAYTSALLLEVLQEAPDVAANLGVENVAGVELDPAAMPDFSPEGYSRRQLLLPRWQRQLHQDAIQAGRQDDAVTLAVLDHVFEQGLYSAFPGSVAAGFVAEPHPVTHISGVHTVLTALLVRDHSVNTVDDLESYLLRLDRIGDVVDGAVATLKLRREGGQVAPAITLALALNAIESFLSSPTDQNLFLLALRSKAVTGGIADAAVENALYHARRIIVGAVYPAYARLVAELRLHLSDQILEPGAWRLADGDSWYAWKLKSYTTLECSAEVIREIGLREVEGLRQRISDAATTAGVQAREVGEVFRELAARQQQSSGDLSDSQVLPKLRQIIKASEHSLRHLFSDWPAPGVVVEAIPESLLGSMYTHYVPGRGGGSDRKRDALLCVNTEQLRQLGASGLPIMVYHEVFPGHHLQLGVAAQAHHLSEFRRALLFPGFLEGWAKYAERLGSEVVDLPDSAFAVLAQLQSELYSSANLVLDTGLHCCRWSVQQGIEYFVTQTGAARAVAEVMVARSAAMPAQLTAYKMGMLSIEAAMDRMRRHCGADFELRRFHDLILGLGAVPLPILDEAVATDLSDGITV